MAEPKRKAAAGAAGAKAKAKAPRKRAPRAAASKPTGDGIVIEPSWEQLLPDAGERAAAQAHWHTIAGEMRERETLSAANSHTLLRLVLAYIVYDRCSLRVAIDGLVTEPSANNPKAIPRLSAHYKAMEGAAKEAERLEAQLGLSPGRRGRVGKVVKKRDRSAGADAFLGPKG